LEMCALPSVKLHLDWQAMVPGVPMGFASRVGERHKV
jgi:hypothetical protein